MVQVMEPKATNNFEIPTLDSVGLDPSPFQLLPMVVVLFGKDRVARSWHAYLCSNSHDLTSISII